MRLNFWTPTFRAWGSDFKAVDMPWYLLFDWIELYNYNGTTKTFEKAWRDDFNNFDQTRWHKMSGSFEGNSSSFSPQNAYVSGGNLVLKLEPLDNVHMHERHFDHSHYSSETHRLEREVEHMEESSKLIRDAIQPHDQTIHAKPALGKLEPRLDLGAQRVKGKEQKEQAKPSLHLQPTVQHTGEEPRQVQDYHSFHTLHRELDHSYDSQHDVEPVHFHETAIHKAFHEAITGEDLILEEEPNPHKKQLHQPQPPLQKPQPKPAAQPKTPSPTEQSKKAVPTIHEQFMDVTDWERLHGGPGLKHHDLHYWEVEPEYDQPALHDSDHFQHAFVGDHQDVTWKEVLHEAPSVAPHQVKQDVTAKVHPTLVHHVDEHKQTDKEKASKMHLDVAAKEHDPHALIHSYEHGHEVQPVHRDQSDVHHYGEDMAYHFYSPMQDYPKQVIPQPAVHQESHPSIAHQTDAKK